MDIKRLNDIMLTSLNKLSSGNRTFNLEMKAKFDVYGRKMSKYGNITDEVEWNLLTANEFVTSIQTTIGNIID